MAKDSDWTLVGVLDQPDADRQERVHTLLTDWLNERGLTDTRLDDDDVKVDLVYLGPGNGCDVRVWIRTRAVTS